MSTHPAGLRHVDHDSVRAAVLHLDVAVRLTAADAERLVHVVATDRAGRTQPVGDLFEAFNLEADVMDPAVATPALGARRLVVLEAEDRHVEVAVAQEAAPGVRVLDLRDLL